MHIRADNDPRFTRRFLFMGIIAIGFALWCLKDAIISYPGSRAQGFEQFKAGNSKITIADAVEFEATGNKEDRIAWQQFAHNAGFKTGPDIATQYVMAVIAALAGLYLLSLQLRARGRWIEMDDTGIRSSWGQAFEFEQVESLNKRKWRDKGIAKVTYLDGNRKRQFVVDDMKFMREPTDQILFELEQRIEIERIIGGPPESIGEVEIAEGAVTGTPTSADGAS